MFGESLQVEGHVFKADGRSRVWVSRELPGVLAKHGGRCVGVCGGGGVGGWVFVIKRHEYQPWRQLLALCVGLHPSQRERRRAGRLMRAGLDVVPIECVGYEWMWGMRGGDRGKRQAAGEVGGVVVGVVGGGGGRVSGEWGVRVWQATRWRGVSLRTRMAEEQDVAMRRRMMESAGRLTGEVMRAGFFNRDHKSDNILVDPENPEMMWLIDVVGVRWSWSCRKRLAMLSMLRKTLGEAGVSDGEWAWCEQAVWACVSGGGRGGVTTEAQRGEERGREGRRS